MQEIRRSTPVTRPPSDRSEVKIRSRAELRDWLAENHANDAGVWIVHYKKSSPHYVPMGDIVAECLAHGWVDSLVRRKDDLRSMHWIAPRKPGSNWSATNKKLIAELESSALMTSAGRKVIDAAKTDGSWTRLDGAALLEVPDDLANAFAKRPDARANWEAFSKSVRRNNLEWLLNAKRAETRERRVRDIADKAEKNERANQ